MQTVISTLVVSLILLCSCTFQQDKEALPIYGDVPIPSFLFLDQDGQPISDKHLEGKVYVADFFFTTCPSICPVMHQNMLTIYQAFKGNPKFSILSYTIDPARDTIPVLKAYAQKLGVSSGQWYFVCGQRDIVYQLAQRNYLVAVKEDKDAPGGLLHQGYFVLVDREKRVRGAYDGTDTQQVNQLIKDIKKLIAQA